MPDNLKEYNRKRHFDQTAEPRGQEAEDGAGKLRFVVQHHLASRDHYDFRLEWEGVLKSWAVPKGPSYSSRDKRLAVQVEDHPLEYRNFEGTIPKGEYGGGAVQIWDEGYWRPEGDAAAGLAGGSLKFSLKGSRLKGRWALVRMKPKPGEKNNNWLLIKEKDEYENAFDIKKFTDSARSGRSLAEIEAGDKVPAPQKGTEKPTAGKGSAAKPPSGEARPAKEPAVPADVKTATRKNLTRNNPAEKASARKSPSAEAAVEKTSAAKAMPVEARALKDPAGKKNPAASGRKKAKTVDSAADLPISHPEKVLFKQAGITKGELAAYYLAVAERMMPYLEKRILSVVRCPDGVDGSCFFKKHPASEGPGVTTVPIAVSEGGNENYFYLADARGLVSEVQMNTLEFHAWGSRVETLEQPDMMVFDLDPDEGLDLEKIRQGVKDLKGILDQLSLVSYLKTSGGKGYHVVIPFRPAAGWEKFHDFARNTARTMEATWPDRYTSNVRKDQRRQRIFIDWMRNGRGATSVAPYSVRAREGAAVSLPISWKELETVGPADITMREAVRRTRLADPWADFFKNRQRLK